jgi:hypothetical protein
MSDAGAGMSDETPETPESYLRGESRRRRSSRVTQSASTALFANGSRRICVRSNTYLSVRV